MLSTTNVFTSHALSESEQRAAWQLSSLTVAALQTHRAQIAEEKLNLVFTPNDVLTYTQQEAYLKGQLDMLSYILDCCEESSQFQQAHIKE